MPGLNEMGACATRHIPGICLDWGTHPKAEYGNTVHDPDVSCCGMGGWHEATWASGGRWVGQKLPLYLQHTMGEWVQHDGDGAGCCRWSLCLQVCATYPFRMIQSGFERGELGLSGTRFLLGFEHES